MSNFKAKILELLNEIKGSGSFVSHQVMGFQFPGLEVDKVGEISYPINEKQAKTLIKKARKAPFGKGSKTIVDPNVRSAWEIDAADLKFTGIGWNGFLNKVLDRIKPDLGIEEYDITASMYKMLIYGEGDFFLPHKDSEKEKGMFGTLIIALPSRHSGGELLIKFDGKQECVDFAEDASTFKMPYAAFYADCEHEIKPITSGHRICLVYNLVQQKSAKTIKLESLEGQVIKLADLLQQEEQDPEKPTRVILLGHQYTPENFSMQSLKLNDRSKAEALLRAADRAGYHSKMALVTSYVAGMPMVSGYYDDDLDENTAMDEVYDESLSIEHWMDDGLPSLKIQFREDDLIAAFHLDDDEPIVKEMEGYMGNYGPDLMHWYHYGAVLLWSKKSHAALLPQQDTTTKLEWIAYYNKRNNELTNEEISAAEAVLLSDLGAKDHEKPDYSPIVDWLINRNDGRYFADVGSTLLQRYFVKMDTRQLVRLADTYPTTFAATITRIMGSEPEISAFEHFLSLLNELASNPKSELDSWVAAQAKTLPTLLAALTENADPKKPIVKKETWSNLLDLEKKLPQSGIWVAEMAKLVTACRQRKYINDVVVREIMTRKQKTLLSGTVLKICHDDLQQRVNNKPRCPTNWSRELPDTKSDVRQWAILAAFLESPDESVFDYRKNQHERSLLENAIKKVTIDLKFGTIRKGSPHTLHITKTQASYQRQMRMWNQDVALLEQVTGEMGV